MKTYSLLLAVLCGLSMVSLNPVASEEVAASEIDESPLRQLVRGRSSVAHDVDEFDDEDDERELGRVKARNGSNGNGDSSSKGSKGGSSKGSKGSSGSKGSKGSKGGSSSRGGGGGRPGRPGCGADCGAKDFAYLCLKGFSFFGQDGDNSTAVVPIEGTGIFNATKPGSTIRIFEDDLRGYAEYYDHGDDHPYRNDIHGRLTGSCTILDFFPGSFDQFGEATSEVCVAHCTTCITYKENVATSLNTTDGEISNLGMDLPRGTALLLEALSLLLAIYSSN